MVEKIHAIPRNDLPLLHVCYRTPHAANTRVYIFHNFSTARKFENVELNERYFVDVAVMLLEQDVTQSDADRDSNSESSDSSDSD